jgi:hypothetical protein
MLLPVTGHNTNRYGSSRKLSWEKCTAYIKNKISDNFHGTTGLLKRDEKLLNIKKLDCIVFSKLMTAIGKYVFALIALLVP